MTGRATRGDSAGTRYAPGNQTTAALNAKYDTPSMHTAVADLLSTIDPLKITGAEACLRWLFYHSILNGSDGVILGASKTSQIIQNMVDISKGPLPEIVVQKIDSLFAQLH